MIYGLVSAVRFWWTASAGTRLRPWRSPYLQWRMETYSGKPAGTLRAGDFLRMAWVERRQIRHFFVWISRMEELAKGTKRRTDAD